MSQMEVTLKENLEPQKKIARCVEIVLATVKPDPTLRPPRTEEERQNGFAKWLAACHCRYDAVMQAAVCQELAHLCHAQAPDAVRNIIGQHIWPEIESWLQTYAVRYFAGAWVRKQIGDATTLSMPIAEGTRWRVPLGNLRFGEDVGQVVLNAEGYVISHLSTTGEEMRENIDARRFPSAQATS